MGMLQDVQCVICYLVCFVAGGWGRRGVIALCELVGGALEWYL